MKSEPGIRGESRIYLDNTRLGDLKKMMPNLSYITRNSDISIAMVHLLVLTLGIYMLNPTILKIVRLRDSQTHRRTQPFTV